MCAEMVASDLAEAKAKVLLNSASVGEWESTIWLPRFYVKLVAVMRCKNAY
jgi:hypothetical protein